MTTPAITLVEPNAGLLADYAAALRAGWSPNTMRDVSGEELAAVEADPALFLEDLTARTGTIRLADGRDVPRLPSRLFWISDGHFCGSIGLRFMVGSDDLPDHVPGHIGYSVVPWKQRRGFATRALALLLPYAWAEGLRCVTISCDSDNIASQKVITANGGVLCDEMAGKFVYRISA